MYRYKQNSKHGELELKTADLNQKFTAAPLAAK